MGWKVDPSQGEKEKPMFNASRMFRLGAGTMALAGVLAGGAWAQNADVRSDTKDIRSDRRDTRSDTRDVRSDKRDVVSDKQQLRQDVVRDGKGSPQVKAD